jgi:tRNA-intron endonuclease
VFLPVGDPYRDMDIRFDGQQLRAGTEARERFYDSRGYGRPRGAELDLAPVEAAHLLFRGDLGRVRDARAGHEQRLGFEGLLASKAVSEVSFFVYKDLRDRGFYLSPVRESGDEPDGEHTGEFVVYPRGQGPWDDAVAYRVRAASEREGVSARALRALVKRAAEGATAVLAVVDEESEVTYLELGDPTVEGATDHAFPPVEGSLLSDRVLVTDPPAALYGRAFYGQRLDPDGGVQLSLVEATYLAQRGLLDLDASQHSDPEEQLRDRGSAVEGPRFDRRLRAYSALREAGIVPKTGFKFGADFRTYAEVESVEELGHSELLVRVLPGEHVFAPRDLALDVRLAHGVRKRMVFALVGEGLSWLVAERLTP